MQSIHQHNSRYLIGKLEVAPAVTCAIVRTHSGKARKLWLHEMPIQIRTLMTIFQNNRWATLASAAEMKPMTADIHQFARRTIKFGVAIARPAFVGKSDGCRNKKQQYFCRDQGKQSAIEASSEVVLSDKFGEQSTDCHANGDYQGRGYRPTNRM